MSALNVNPFITSRPGSICSLLPGETLGLTETASKADCAAKLDVARIAATVIRIMLSM